MLSDIHRPEVTDIAIAIVKEPMDDGTEGWNVYLLNLKDEPIEVVLVSSKGYGELEGEPVRTSVLRHLLDTMPPQSYAKVEPIMEDVFSLSNEYFVSFYINGVIYEKKFIFLPETINEEYYTMIPLLDKKGVMIR